MSSPLTTEELNLIQSGAVLPEEAAIPLNRLIASLREGNDWKVREYAADHIGTLARSEDQRKVLAQAGAIPHLSAALKNALSEIQAQEGVPTGGVLSASFKVVRAIGNMTYYDAENSAAFLADGAVEATATYLSEMVHRKCAGGAKFAAATTGNLASECAEAKTVLVQHGALQSLTELIKHWAQDPVTAMFSTRALGNISSASAGMPSENAGAAIKCGAPQALVAAGLADPTDDIIGCGLRTTCLTVLEELCFAEGGGAVVPLWANPCVDNGLYTLLFRYASTCPYPDSAVDEEEEEEGTSDKKSLSESSSELFAALSGDAYAVQHGLIPILGDVLRFVNGPVVNNRRKLLVASARHDLSRAIANACSVSEPMIDAFMKGGFVDTLVPMINNKDLSIKINAISIIYVLCTSEERCLTIASFENSVFVKTLVAAVRDSVDSDAIALRALSALQNLCVPRSTRAVVRREGFVPALAGFLERITNPILLFGAVISARYLISDCSEKEVVDECIDAGVIANIAHLAKGEKGIPDPSKTDDGEEDEEKKKKKKSEEPKEKDMRVSYEATRILARLVARVPEAREKVLALPGVAEGFALTLDSKFPVLKTETSEALKAITTDVNSERLKALLCGTPEAFDELLSKAI